MTSLDALVVTTALSTIRRDLDASVAQLEWTVNAYNLSFAVLLMTAAALGDRFGRRRRVRRRHRALRHRLRGVRARPERRRADRRPRRAGRGRRGGHHARPHARRRRHPARAPRRRPRRLLRRQRPGRGRRAARGRRRHPGPGLAVDLLAERADRRRARAARARAGPREPRPGLRARPPGPRRSSAPACSAIVWALVRGNAAGWASAEVLAALAGGARAARRASSAFELRAAAPMLPMRFFRSRAFSAGNAAIFCAVGVALLRGLLHGPVPPGRARLRSARRRA